MNSRLLVCALVVGAFAGDALGQQRSQYNMGYASNWWSRGGSIAGMTNNYTGRYDEEKVRGLPPFVNGGRFWLLDFDTTTNDTYKAQIHKETAPGSNLPDATAVFSTGALPALQGVQTVTFNRPVPLPVGDFWFGVQFQDGAGVSTINILRGDSTTLNPATNNFDLAGPGLLNRGNPPADSNYAFWEGTGTPITSSFQRTVGAEPLHDPTSGLAGVAIARTNQPYQPGRNDPQGVIAGFNSAAYPDSNSTPKNTGRQDDVGYWVEGALANGNLVIFFLALKFGPPIPLNQGTFVLDLPSLLFVGSVTGNGSGQAHALLPNAAINQLANIEVFWQAIVVNPANLEIYGAPGARQRF